MSQQILLVLGGIGLFLFGMKVMTEGLRDAAGGRLRRFLARFTTTPLRGTVSGAAATALIQSSSATTVMTVGFVGAGLITFPHALGVLYGANIGTTVTGWMITLLGFKLHLGTIALPGLFAASLMVLLGRGHLARAGRILAGFSLLFVGLDMMQDAAGTFGETLTPDRLPQGTLAAQVKLALAGLAITLVMQSSSAAIAVALVFLGSGAISFDQAAAMVIGTNIGTTVTAMLASIGGSRTMRQTAVANLLFNVGTAILAFPVLLLGGGWLASVARHAGDQTALVLFHTAFNVAGTLIFLPVSHHFAGFVERLIPETDSSLTRGLDEALLGDEGAAMDAVHVSLRRVAVVTFAAMGRALAVPSDTRALSALPAKTGPALEQIGAFASRIRIPEKRPGARDRNAALLHQLDHLNRLTERLERKAMIAVVLEDAELSRPARYFGLLLSRTAQAGRTGALADRLTWLAGLVQHRSRRHRRAVLLHEHVGLITVNEMFDRTDAMRWLNRVTHHAERMAYYDRQAEMPEGGHAPGNAG